MIIILSYYDYYSKLFETKMQIKLFVLVWNPLAFWWDFSNSEL